MDSEVSLKGWVEKYITEKDGKAFLGFDDIKNFQQVHLAIAYSNGHHGTLNSYIENASMYLAKKALEHGCTLVVERKNCQNKPKENTVIIAGTGLRRKSNPSLEENLSLCDFSKANLSHIDKNEFLRRMGENPDDYSDIKIHINYQGVPDEDYVGNAEIKLSKRAIKKGCKYITNINYTIHHPEMRAVSISGKGLKPKKK